MSKTGKCDCGKRTTMKARSGDWYCRSCHAKDRADEWAESQAYRESERLRESYESYRAEASATY